MYIVNTSFMVDAGVQTRWLELVGKKYIPFLKQQGFEEVTFTRVVSADAIDHFTYSLQIEIADLSRYKELTEDIFGEYKTIADELFGDKVMWFTSLMKKVEY